MFRIKSLPFIYKAFLVILIALELVWYFFPWGMFYDNNVINAMIWLGYGSIFEIDKLIVISKLVFILNIISYMGMFFYFNWAKYLFLFMNFILFVNAFVFGFSISSPVESAVGFALTLTSGFIFGLVFFSPLNIKFKSKHD